MKSFPQVAILGTGCIGAYLAGSLLPHKYFQQENLLLIGREKQQATIDKHGIKTTDYLGNTSHTSTNINFIPNSQLSKCSKFFDIVLVTVKCTSVQQTIQDLAYLVNTNTIIVALQNGFGSEQYIINAFPDHTVLTGVVGFNVIEQNLNHFHRGTEGKVIIEHHQSAKLNRLIFALNQQNIPTELSTTIDNIRWGKLLLNLNNAINALSDIPLKAQIENKGYRKILAHCMLEALTVLKASKITPARFTKIPPIVLPWILKLPSGLFKVIANQMLAIDPLARSSMWYDITQNCPTEIDYLNGAIVCLAKQNGISTPWNETIIAQVKIAEKIKAGSPSMSAETLISMANC